MEARITTLSDTLAVVSRPKRERLVVTRRGGKVASSVDPRAYFIFKPSTFKANTSITMEVKETKGLKGDGQSESHRH